MPVTDWYCCISVALDAEEDEWYNKQYVAWISAGNSPKDFPKRPQRYVQPRKAKAPTEAPAGKNPFDMVMGALSRGGVPLSGRKGSIEDYARAKGLEKVYQTADGKYVTKDGTPVEPPPGSVFVES